MNKITSYDGSIKSFSTSFTILFLNLSKMQERINNKNVLIFFPFISLLATNVLEVKGIGGSEC